MMRTDEDYELRRFIPDVTWCECQAIRENWGVFYHNPLKFKWLKPIIIDWLRNGDGKIEVEEWKKQISY